VKRLAIVLALSTLSTSVYADYNLSCSKDHGRAYPLRINETKKTLAWRGKTYNITPSQYDDLDGNGCGKFGFNAKGNGTSFKLCFTT
jgi:hypothetical protein